MKKNGDKPDVLIESEKIVNDYAKKLYSPKKEKSPPPFLLTYLVLSALGTVGGIIFLILK